MRTAFLTMVIAVSCAAALSADSVVQLGPGSYAVRLPAGAKQPPDGVFATDAIRPPLPTNDWSSSLLWAKFSERQYPHPLAVCAAEAGLRVYYPGPSIHANPIGIFGAMPEKSQDLILAHSGVEQFPDARLHACSDWFVSARFASAQKQMVVSYGHGSPFVYALYEGGGPRITFQKPPEVWSGDAQSAVLGVTAGGRHYGLFAPAGSTWSGLGTGALSCDAKGKAYFSLAVLPDREAETLELFRRHAHTHVIDTKVSWSYDRPSAVVTTTFAFTTRAYEGEEKETLFAMYPHQWRRSATQVLGKTYASVRGVMELAKGLSFTTRMVFPGVLPALPDVEGYDKAKLRAYVREVAEAAPAPFKDTYWEGKHLGKLAALAPLAEHAGDEDAAAKLHGELKRRLEAWFTAADAKGAVKPATLFGYDRRWGTLIGYPASYGSDTELNDHHFHYGYFVMAAAEVARRDAAWAKRWGPFVALLVSDFAAPDRDDPMFPFLRNFDPYAGHSWACGHARFGDGNNQESSSEAMNAWTGLILWGTATGDDRLRDLGIWLYTTEMQAIEEYWFDAWGRNRPAAYTPSVVTLVWGGKGVNETWFSNRPEAIHMINWLPIHGGSLYLGRNPAYVRRNYEALVAERGGTQWRETACLIWMYQALYDPAGALAAFERNEAKFPLEAGNSRANLYHWLHATKALGRVDRTTTADHPLVAIFNEDETRRYAVYNPDAQPRRVRFSDGMEVEARPGGFTVAERRIPWRSLFNGQDLAGWKAVGSAEWKVQDGIIFGGQHGDPKRSGLLTSTESFRDFELELEFAIDEHGKYNSGVYLRNSPGAGGRTGYQVNIGRAAAKEYAAGIFTNEWLSRGDESDAIRRKLDWNTLRIVAQGGHITVDLNGVNVADYADPAPAAHLVQPGVLAFQTYGADGHAGWVKLRNLRIRN